MISYIYIIQAAYTTCIICVCVFVYVCTRMYVCMCVFVFVCIFAKSYTVRFVYVRMLNNLFFQVLCHLLKKRRKRVLACFTSELSLILWPPLFPIELVNPVALFSPSLYPPF